MFWKRKKQAGAEYAKVLEILCKRVEAETEARLLREGKLSYKTDLVRALIFYLPATIKWVLYPMGRTIYLRLEYDTSWVTRIYREEEVSQMNWPDEIVRLRKQLLEPVRP